MKKNCVDNRSYEWYRLGLCALRFSKGGYDLVLTGRNQSKLDLLQSRLNADGTDVKLLNFDVRDRKAATEAVNTLTGKWADIDVLINNAGLALGFGKRSMNLIQRNGRQ